MISRSNMNSEENFMKAKAKWFSAFLILTLLLIMIVPGVGAASSQQPYSVGTAQTYVVLYKSNAVSADAATVMQNAGGTLIYSYAKIGVVIASSGNNLFRSNLMRDRRIEGVSATANFGVQLNDEFEVADAT